MLSGPRPARVEARPPGPSNPEPHACMCICINNTYVHICVYLSLSLYIYIYIYREREMYVYIYIYRLKPELARNRGGRARSGLESSPLTSILSVCGLIIHA